MGCDIHMMAEAKRHVNDKEVWTNIDNWALNPRYEEGNKYEPQYRLRSIYEERDYELFWMLCEGVRGSADNNSLSPERGVPDDVSKETAKIIDDYGEDGHSHSFLTLKELQDFFESNKSIKYDGMVSPETAKSLDEEGTLPNEWYGGTTDKTWVYRKWEMPNDGLKKIIDGLRQLVVDSYMDPDSPGMDERVRIVFFFDN